MALISNPELLNSCLIRTLPISLEAPVTKIELVVPDEGYFISGGIKDYAGFSKNKLSSHKSLDL